MPTVIDTAALPPTPATIKAAGHAGQIVYISPDRTGGSLPGKPVTRAHVDAMRAAGLSLGVVWQYGKDSSTAPPDVMRGREGGLADAKAADAKLKELGLDDWPVYMAVDFDITLQQWNDVAVHYFRAVGEVLGRDRVGIYGHGRVCDWAMEDSVIANLGNGRQLAWQTRSWSGNTIHKSAVLYQKVVDTPTKPGPTVGGVRVDVNDVFGNYWGQTPISEFRHSDVMEGTTGMDEAQKTKYLDVNADIVKIMSKHYTPGRNGKQIRYIVRHHLAGIGDTSTVWGWWQTRAASAHYVVEPSGRVGQLVWDKDTAWASGNANAESIAIEHSNSGGAAQDWPISDTVIIAGARWAAALCLFYGLGRPEYGKNIFDHRDFMGTACPHHLARGGKYHQRWMDEAVRWYDHLVAVKNGDITAPTNPEPPKKENPIVSHFTSLINPNVKISLPEDAAALADAYMWKQEVAMRGLYEALGMDYDATIEAAIAQDNA